jgi:hypothetical protein
MPQSFSLLPTSPHFALIPSSKLGRVCNGRAELKAKSEIIEWELEGNDALPSSLIDSNVNPR